MPTNERISSLVASLLEEGEDLLRKDLERSSYENYAKMEPFAKWLTACRNLIRLLGESAKVFEEPFLQSAEHSGESRCRVIIGTLRALKDAVDHGLLLTVKELVFAEAFSDLLEQAEELLQKGYVLAAGVICRAVFEEHLRQMCDAHDCMPEGKPTIEPLKVALVKAGVLTKLDAKNVDAIAGEGNHCAHNNQPPLTPSEVQGLVRRVLDFLTRHQLA